MIPKAHMQVHTFQGSHGLAHLKGWVRKSCHMKEQHINLLPVTNVCVVKFHWLHFVGCSHLIGWICASALKTDEEQEMEIFMNFVQLHTATSVPVPCLCNPCPGKNSMTPVQQIGFPQNWGKYFSASSQKIKYAVV